MIGERGYDLGGLLGPALVALTAMVGIPFYFGFIHLPIFQLLVYAPFAGSAMVAGTHFDKVQCEISNELKDIAIALGFWTLLTLVIGATSYLLALVL